MTGYEVAAALLKHKGKVFVTASFGSNPFLQIVKSDAVDYFRRKGSEKTGAKLDVHGDRAYLSLDFDE